MNPGPPAKRDAATFSFPSIPFNFAGLEDRADFGSAETVVLPIPIETGPPTEGSSQSPPCIVMASREVELYDMELGCEVHSRGIYTHGELVLNQASLNSALQGVQDCVGAVLDAGKFPLVVGGDRAVALAGVRAAVERAPDVAAVLISGRADLRDRAHGRGVGPRMIARRIAEIVPALLAGFRSFTDEDVAFLGQPGHAAAIDAERFLASPDDLARMLPPHGAKAYLSVDCNVLDPALMPFASNIDPGGLAWSDLTKLLRLVFERLDIVAADVCGFVPVPGNPIPEQVASRVALKIVGYRFFLPRGGAAPSASPGPGGRR